MEQLSSLEYTHITTKRKDSLRFQKLDVLLPNGSGVVVNANVLQSKVIGLPHLLSKEWDMSLLASSLPYHNSTHPRLAPPTNQQLQIRTPTTLISD